MAKYIDLPNLKENLTNFLNKKINPIYAKKTEIPSNVSELNNDKSYQTAEEVGQAVTDGVAKIVAGAPEDFDTLKEMSDWISSHETSAAAMNSAISDNSVAIANHAANSDIHVTKEEKTKWNKLDSDLKDGTIIVAEATKATQDAQGNIIDTTYAKKTEIPQETIVDDALSSTSTNSVQNKVVKAEFDKVNSSLTDSKYGELAGGKNLFNGKYISSVLAQGTDYTNRNLYNEFSSISNITGLKYLIFGRYFKKGTYTFSYTNDNFLSLNRAAIAGSPCVVASNAIRKSYTWTQNIDGYTYFTIEADKSETSDVDIPFKSTPDIQIEEGITATEYEPYFSSNKMLTDESTRQNDSLSSLGKCKNLMNPTLQTTTQNDVTCTNNGDGTYTLKGTASETAVFALNDLKLVAGIYKMTGCPNGGSQDTYKLNVYSEELQATYLNDYGDGNIENVPALKGTARIVIYKGKTVNNIVFKPMITTNLNATYDDFVPYTGEGDTLIDDVAKINSNLNTKVNIVDPVFTGSFSQNREADSAIGENSHAEGHNTVASGLHSHAEGSGTTASGMQSHAEGSGTEASSLRSHAEGANTTASKEMSHAEGYATTASGTCSHAEGNSTTASHNSSHAEGNSTTASNFASHAAGKLNAPMTTGGTFGNTTGTAFVIGNGTSATALSNAFSVQYNGTVKAKSTITASTTADYAEFFEWLDENPNNEDRVGYFVTLDGNRIKIASNNDDYILGIVSGEPFVLGNGDCDTWNKMYLHDEFRRTIYEPAPKVEEVEIKEEQEETYIDKKTGEEKTRTVEVVVGHEFKEVEGEFDGTRPKLNPDYDNTQQYISRFDRKEWSPVGMLGVLAVRHDGTAKVNGYVTVNKDGIATACDRNIENSYRVIKANTDSVVEIIFK